jgi:hypothetical protein
VSVTTTTRFGITRWSAGTDPFTRAQMDASHAAIEAVGVIYAQGTLAARPAAGKVGRFYHVNHNGGPSDRELFWDNGAQWRVVYTESSGYDAFRPKHSEAYGGLSASSGVCTGDLSLANLFALSVTGSFSLNFTNIDVVGAKTWTVIVANFSGSSRTITSLGATWCGNGAAPAAIPNGKVAKFDYAAVYDPGGDFDSVILVTGGVQP